MTIKAQKIRLGIFITFGTALLFFLIIFFTAREILKKSDTYYVSFKGVSVSGMEIGNQVRYLGVKVGTIANIEINPQDVTSIIVTLSLNPQTPVKEDSQADITTLGITGLKAIEIRGGSNEAPKLRPGEFITAGSSLTNDITGKAEIIAEKAEQVINNLLNFTQEQNLTKIMDLIDSYHSLAQNTNSTVTRLESMLVENENNIHKTITNTKNLTESLSTSATKIETTINRVNNIVNNDTIDKIITNTWEISETLKETEIKKLIEELALVTSQTKQLLIKLNNNINKGSKDLEESQQLIKATLNNLHEASQKINENPSVLIRKSKTKNMADEQLKNN